MAYLRSLGIVAKRWGTVEEMADAVAFLASDRAELMRV
jgi:NAD(P)-dependent dehydrogenase (short-subunit alcohol dehydrogenase family)